MSDETALSTIEEGTADVVIQRMHSVLDLMKRAMEAGTDYGKIPGTGSKPTLLKPGAEKLCVMFRLCPKYETEKIWDGNHLTVETVCTIFNARGEAIGQASAMCSTKESKYAYRKAERVCPSCGKPAIIKGKAEYGGGWLCWAKKEGCNAKFADDDPNIVNQVTGRVENEDLADLYNTVLRLAEKRAFVAAVRLATGSSSLFDEEGPQHVEEPPRQEPKEERKEEPAKSVLEQVKKTIATNPGIETTSSMSRYWMKQPDNNPDRVDAMNAIHSYASSKMWEWDVDNGKYVEKVF